MTHGERTTAPGRADVRDDTTLISYWSAFSLNSMPRLVGAIAILKSDHVL